MTLSGWRIEVARVLRTHRLVAMIAIFLIAGAVGPLTTYYAQDIFAATGGTQITVIVARPTAAQAMLNFYRSGMQLGAIAVAVITALAVCFDNNAALAIYYRSRADMRRILLPRLVITALSALVAYAIGALLAGYETWALIGAPDAGATLGTLGYGALYLVFVLALTLLVSGVFRSPLAVVGISVAIFFLMSFLDGIAALHAILPAALVTAPSELYRHASVDWVPVVLTAVAVPLAVAVALWLVARREVAG